MELFFANKIPHLRVYRQKVYLPVDDKSQSTNSLIFLLNHNIDTSITLMNNQRISHNYRFHNYYIDNVYQGKVFGRFYRQVITKERQDLYEKVKKNTRGMNTQTTFNAVSGRNVFVDLMHYNKIFFDYAKKAFTFRIKSIQYIDFIKSIYNDPKYSSYTKKIVMIDVNAWSDNLKAEIKGNKFHENPIFLIYFAMFKVYDKFKELGDIDFIFHTDLWTFRMNPSKCDTRSYSLFRNELARLSNNKLNISDDTQLEKEIEKQEVVDTVVKNFNNTYGFTGEDEQEQEEIDNKVKDRIEEIIEDKPEGEKEIEKDDLTIELVNDEKVLKALHDVTIKTKTGSTTANNKRDEQLREEQKKLKVDNMTIDDIRKLSDRKVVIEKNDVSDKLVTTNPNITEVKFPNFEKAYNDKLLKSDMMNTLMSLNEKSIPVYILGIEVEDTSDELNYIETYTVKLEDSNRVRHTLKFDMPKFLDDKFVYLNGNRKIINKQLMAKPVIKTGPDSVQVVTNYNKIFIRRYGGKISSKLEKFKKAISEMKISADFDVKYGNNLAANNKYKTNIEYDELSKDFTSIRIGNGEILFNQDEVHERLKNSKRKIRDSELCIGFFINSKDPIIIDADADRHGIVDFIMSIDKGQYLVDLYEDATSGKKFMYSRATIMKRQVPIILLLGFLEGLSTVLRKASIKHYFTDKRPKLDSEQNYVQFANGYLVYDIYPFQNSLIMNAFADIPTKGFDYEEFDDREVYLTLFDTMFGNRIIGNSFINFYEFMIDPITKEVLEDLDYPTDFVNLILFANSLLADNTYIKENNMNLYRVRSNELVNVYLYDAISSAYSRYRSTANNNNPVKISIPRDFITKSILMAQTVEDYSTLNPIVELEKSRTISPRGPSGMNLDQAYTQDKRAYDKTMLGIIAMSTSPDSNVGKIRQLSLEPNIISPRGYIDIKDDRIGELKDVNIFSPAEMLSPLGASRDDSNRTAMATKQSKHIIPVEKSSPVLISNGAEQVIPYHLSNDFSFVAKDHGEVVEVDDKTGTIIIGYYDTGGPNGAKGPNGKSWFREYVAIDISPKIVKNSSGGFFLSNKLISDLKVGQKFKKNDILASDEKFFTRSKMDGVRFNIGSLQKTACMSSYSTYEDSTFITKKLSEEMSSEIVMQKTIVLGKNANVDFLVEKGDQISVGDDLIRFETSMEDDSLNKFLSTIGEELHEEIHSLGKFPIRSKYTGVIEDIKIYSTVDVEELSPSIQKIVRKYYRRIEQVKSLLGKYDKSNSSVKCGYLLNEPTGKIETKDGKVKGNEVNEGILIEIYIKYRDTMGVGDKLAFFTALKSIVGEIIPEGYEPYSEFRPDEEVSSFIAPSAILARMTPSILLTMFGNKVLVELKRRLQEIYTGKPWENK